VGSRRCASVADTLASPPTGAVGAARFEDAHEGRTVMGAGREVRGLGACGHAAGETVGWTGGSASTLVWWLTRVYAALRSGRGP
jgi:hypothetical protein